MLSVKASKTALIFRKNFVKIGIYLHRNISFIDFGNKLKEHQQVCDRTFLFLHLSLRLFEPYKSTFCYTSVNVYSDIFEK